MHLTDSEAARGGDEAHVLPERGDGVRMHGFGRFDGDVVAARSAPSARCPPASRRRQTAQRGPFSAPLLHADCVRKPRPWIILSRHRYLRWCSHRWSGDGRLLYGAVALRAAHLAQSNRAIPSILVDTRAQAGSTRGLGAAHHAEPIGVVAARDGAGMALSRVSLCG